MYRGHEVKDDNKSVTKLVEEVDTCKLLKANYCKCQYWANRFFKKGENTTRRQMKLILIGDLSKVLKGLHSNV